MASPQQSTAPNAHGLTGFGRPVVVNWKVTTRCHHACSFCGNASRLLFDGVFDRAQAMGQIDSIRQSRAYEVWFTGGEPFHAPWFVDVLNEAFGSGLRVGITTTGTILKASSIEVLAANKKQLSFLKVSCHGHSRELYASMHGRDQFHLAERNMRRLRAAEVPFQINLVVSRVNLSAISEICKYLSDCGASAVSILPVKSAGGAMRIPDVQLRFDEILPIFAELDGLRKAGAVTQIRYGTQDIVARELCAHFPNLYIETDSCSAHSILQIEADGRMSLCSQIRDMGLKRETVDLYLSRRPADPSVEEAWNSPHALSFRANMYKATRHDQCTKCPSHASGRCTPCSFGPPDCDEKLAAIEAYQTA